MTDSSHHFCGTVQQLELCATTVASAVLFFLADRIKSETEHGHDESKKSCLLCGCMKCQNGTGKMGCEHHLFLATSPIEVALAGTLSSQIPLEINGSQHCERIPCSHLFPREPLTFTHVERNSAATVRPARRTAFSASRTSVASPLVASEFEK